MTLLYYDVDKRTCITCQHWQCNGARQFKLFAGRPCIEYTNSIGKCKLFSPNIRAHFTPARDDSQYCHYTRWNEL